MTIDHVRHVANNEFTREVIRTLKISAENRRKLALENQEKNPFDHAKERRSKNHD